MFRSDNKKRPSPELSNQGIRLKKPYKIAYGNNLDVPNADILSHEQFKGRPEVNFSTPADCFSPQTPGFISKVYTPHLIEPYHNDTSLHALTDHDISGESTNQSHLWSENGEESLDEGLLLEDDSVVARVCFGVVSLLNFSKCTKTNAHSLM
jgi:hypothetical protein